MEKNKDGTVTVSKDELITMIAKSGTKFIKARRAEGMPVPVALMMVEIGIDTMKGVLVEMFGDADIKIEKPDVKNLDA